jgi:hypothetical protein
MLTSDRDRGRSSSSALQDNSAVPTSELITPALRLPTYTLDAPEVAERRYKSVFTTCRRVSSFNPQTFTDYFNLCGRYLKEWFGGNDTTANSTGLRCIYHACMQSQPSLERFHELLIDCQQQLD